VSLTGLSRRLNSGVTTLSRELKEYRERLTQDRRASDELGGVLEEIGIEEEIA